MDSLPTSRLRLLSLDGQPIDGPIEWEPALIDVLLPESDWQRVELFRQAQKLTVYATWLAGQVHVLANWELSGPGHYQLSLRCDAFSEEQTLTVRSSKLGQQAYAELLSDLDSRLPVSIVMGLQHMGGLAQVKLLRRGLTTTAQELQRLTTAIRGSEGKPGLAYVIPQIAKDPHAVLVTTEVWLPREQARRISPASLVVAMRRASNRAADGYPDRLPDTRVEHTYDVYENRLVKSFLHQVDSRLRRLRPILLAHQQMDAFQTVCKLQEAVKQARQQASFLDDVSLPSMLPANVTSVLAEVPAYRAALQRFIEFRKTATVRLDEPALEAPLENLPFLYQLWGTFEVLLALLDVAKELGYRVKTHNLVKPDPSGLILSILAGGEPCVVLVHPQNGTSIEMRSQRSYGHHGDIQSVSYEQCPDVAIEIRPRSGRVTILLFDPKYKLESEPIAGQKTDGKPKKADIDKMHAYRDAIRQDGRRAVQYAATLYPGLDVFFDAGLQALRAYPGAESRMELERNLREVLKETILASVS
jgi:predicted component of viral defense system (DUF524 family)